jgi:hypothetical protein
MSKLSLQFHAMPDEIPELVAALINDRAIFTTKIAGAPLAPTHFGKDEAVQVDRSTRALAFTLRKPVLTARSIDEFRLANPDALVLSIGQIRDDGLAESWLSAMSDDETAMKRWRQASRIIHGITFSGATAVSPKSGATVPMKSHRFTAGAQKAYMKGLPLLPSGGNTIVRLPTIM